MMKTADVLADAIAWGACPRALTWLRERPDKTIGPDDPPADWAAWYAYHAGMRLPDERWLPHAAKLVTAVCREPMTAQLAGRYWSADRWHAHTAEIVTAICRKPMAAWYVGYDWPDERWQAHAAEIVTAICREPNQARLAGREWPAKRRALVPKEYRPCL